MLSLSISRRPQTNGLWSAVTRKSEMNMADNLALDRSDVPTTEHGGHESNIGRSDWQSDVRGTAREAPIDRDPRESIREDVADAVEEVRENEQNDELRPRRERRRGRAAQEAVEPDQ